ncbi:MAG: serine protease [Rikenellaceae bacterium]|nr:serine protease [Rikenellaceae bacterium]
MFYIVLLIFFGLLFLVAEIVLLPGVSIGALLSMICYGSSIYLAFHDHSNLTGILVIAIILLLSIIATVFSLRAKTWQRFSLRQELDSSSMPSPETELHAGDRGVTISRLSPMGKIKINEKIYEAKSQDIYIDPRCEIEVVGFENFSVIVKKIN